MSAKILFHTALPPYFLPLTVGVVTFWFPLAGCQLSLGTMNPWFRCLLFFLPPHTTQLSLLGVLGSLTRVWKVVGEEGATFLVLGYCNCDKQVVLLTTPPLSLGLSGPGGAWSTVVSSYANSQTWWSPVCIPTKVSEQNSCCLVFVGER